MENKMKCKVVILATNEIQANGVQIIKNNKNNELKIPSTGGALRRIIAGSAVWKTQHLYLVSDEEIKVGDYYLSETFGKFNFFGQKPSILTEDDTELYIKYKELCYKIIATTDTTLNLPLIPQSFIEKYVEVNGKIEEVMVNLENYRHYNNPDIRKADFEYRNRIETRKDNTVIISKVKNTWNYDEHCTDMQYYMEYCQLNGYITPQKWLSEYKHY
jgi:hypothetical protein